MSKKVVVPSAADNAAEGRVLIVPDYYQKYIPRVVISKFEAYFNRRDKKSLEYPFVRNILDNRLVEAVGSTNWVGALVDGSLPNSKDMLWWSVWMLQSLAPERAWGNPTRVANWIRGCNNVSMGKLFQAIDTELLDKLLQIGYPEDALVGRRVNWHGKQIGVLEKWGNELLLKLTMKCQKCGGGSIHVWARRGMVSGMWGFVTDSRGNVFNLRDEVYLCAACHPHGRKLLEKSAGK